MQKAEHIIIKFQHLKNVFDYDFAYQVQLPLDIEAMNMLVKSYLSIKIFNAFLRVIQM